MSTRHEAIARIHAVPAAEPSTGRRAQITIQAYEAQLSIAVAQGGRLLSDVVMAEMEAKVAQAATQEALEELHASISAGLQARKLTISAHAKLGRIVSKLDLNVLGWGDYVYKSEDRAAQPSSEKLRAVATIR